MITRPRSDDMQLGTEGDDMQLGRNIKIYLAALVILWIATSAAIVVGMVL